MRNNIQYYNKVLVRFGDSIREFMSFEDEKQENSEKWKTDDLRNLGESMKKAEIENPWFTWNFQILNLRSWSEVLTEEKIAAWLEKYPELEKQKQRPKKVGLILAGNIPLVGLHDILCVLVSGNIAVTKLSSKDKVVYPVIRNILSRFDDTINERWVILEDEYLTNIDAVIATGSDNSSRYFEYYFGKYPNIIRKNRNSIAILSGSEKDRELKALADDIFLYFGLGCRNVSKLFVPENFKPDDFYRNIEHYAYLYNHNKYANNYDYQKAILMVNRIPIYDNGFLILKNDQSLSSPVGTIHFEYYRSKSELKSRLEMEKDKIQCIVGHDDDFSKMVGFGKTQFPELDDFADDIDTLKFLVNL